eukprot:EG_transcript_10221
MALVRVSAVVLLFCALHPSTGAAGGTTHCLEPSTFGDRPPRTLVYTTLGTYSPDYLEMVQMMVSTTLLHLSPPVDVAVFAHSSWAPHGPSINATVFVPLDEAAFFDLQNVPNATERSPVHAQASTNKLRIFQLMPSAWRYDVIVMLDSDIVVQANFLPLVGTICQDTLYTVSHQQTPRSANHLAHFQFRDLTPGELSYVQARNPFIFNAGQFLFCPSPFIEKLLQEAYWSYVRQPLASLYEQGHLNVVALLSGRVQYSLTHMVLLGLHHAILDPSPAEWPLVHVCGADVPTYVKSAVMRWRFKATARSLQEVRHGIVQRLLRRCNPPVSNTAIRDFQPLLEPYATLVSSPNVTQMCEVGHGAHTAVVALVANPSAGLTVFNASRVPEQLAHFFPTRVTEMPGTVESSVKAYAELVASGQRQPCSTILLPQGLSSLEGTFELIQPIMARPLSFALAAGAAAIAPWPAGTAAALRCLPGAGAGAPPRQWCTWKLQSGA